MLTLDDFARAARDNNKLAESAGIVGMLGDLGITLKDATYIAQQRALRSYYVTIGKPHLALENKMHVIDIPLEHHKLFAALFGAFMDGLVTGVRAQQDVSYRNRDPPRDRD